MRRLRLMFLLLFVALLMRSAANDGTGDVSDVTMSLDAGDLIDALMPKLVPKLVTALQTNQQLLTAFVNAVMPQITAQMATLARQTAGAGTTTPRTGPPPR